MKENRIRIGMTFLTALLFAVLSGFTARAVSADTLEIGEARSLGNQVKVPVRILDTSYLTKGQIEISVAPESKGVTLKGFEKGPLFKGNPYVTLMNIDGDKLKIDFQGAQQSLARKPVVVGYIIYALDDSFASGESVSLEVSNVVATGRSNADITFTTLSGKIERKMPIGDVTGDNVVDASGALRILQHIQGNPIANEEQRLSADVDGDGVLTQNDAQQILDFTTGKRTTFLAIQAKELDPAVLKSEYMEQVEAIHGRKPYQFKGRSIPSGLKVDLNTGKLTGVPTRAGNYKFTIEVTDAIGNTETREFAIDVIDSNISSYEKLLPINVQLYGVPTLPNEVTVTYKDKTKGQEKVTWDPVDTSTLGNKIVKGKIGNTGFTVSVEVRIVSENYIDHIKVSYFEFLNLHTIILNVSPEVYKVTVNGISMHYEGNDEFSLGSSSFGKGAYVTIVLYDKYGNTLETKSQQLIVN